MSRSRLNGWRWKEAREDEERRAKNAKEWWRGGGEGGGGLNLRALQILKSIGCFSVFWLMLKGGDLKNA